MKVKLYCFEGEWNPEHPELSVKPLTEVLQHTYHAFGSDLTCTYRFCQTIERLEKNLDLLDGRKFSNPNCHYCFYFAFHGSSQGLYDCENNFLPFELLAETLGSIAQNSIIFFGSCGAKASEESLKEFKDSTSAKLVVGYGASVDWLASSAFELLFFSELRNRKTVGPFINRIRELTAPDQVLFSNLKVILAY